MKPYTQVISTTFVVVVFSILVVHSAFAATTISTDIVTGGALNVSGAATLGSTLSAGTTTVTNLASTNVSTSTFAGGLNLTSGCFSINGSCVGGGGSLSGGVAGMLSSWINSSTLTATGTPTAASYTATSSTATSTFAGGLQTLLLNITSSLASSTFANGINLTGGCFSINGSCVGGGSANYTNADVNSYINGSSTIPKAYTANTFTGLQAFSNTGTTTFSGGIQGTYLNLTGSSATSTVGNGINIAAGCFAVNGTCLSSGGGGATSPAAASGTVQFNASGSFGSNAGFTFDGTVLTAPSLTLAPGGTIKIGNNTLLDSSGNLNAAVIPREGTASALSGIIPAAGEMVYETDTKHGKIGDGSQTVANLNPLGLWSLSGTTATYNGTTSADTVTGTTLTSTGSINLSSDSSGIVFDHLTPSSGFADTQRIASEDSSGDLQLGDGIMLFQNGEGGDFIFTNSVVTGDQQSGDIPNIIVFDGGKIGVGNPAPSVGVDINGGYRGAVTSTSTGFTCNSTLEGTSVYNKANHHLWLCMGSEPWTLIK